MKKQKKIFILMRNDDPCALSNTEHEKKVFELFAKYQVPHVTAVIPHTVFDPHDEKPSTTHPLHENPELVELIKKYKRKGLLEIAQHGYSHQTNPHRPSAQRNLNSTEPFAGRGGDWLPYAPQHPRGYSEFDGLSEEEQIIKIRLGKEYLEELFKTSLKTFVFPWNTYDETSLKILENFGFKTLLAEEDVHQTFDTELLILGCYFWDVSEYLKILEEVHRLKSPVLLHLTFHSWMLSEENFEALEVFLQKATQQDGVEFVLPHQFESKGLHLQKITRSRAKVESLLRKVREHVLSEETSEPIFYRLSQVYYGCRLLKLKTYVTILKSVGILRALAISSLFVLISSLIFFKNLGGESSLFIQMILFFFLLISTVFALHALRLCFMRENHHLGLNNISKNPITEFVSLAIRNSFVETIREIIARQGAFLDAKKSPSTGEERTVCIIAENPTWGGTEKQTETLIHELLSRDYLIKYLSTRSNKLDPNLLKIKTDAFEIIPLPELSVYDQGNRAKKIWRQKLREIKSYVVFLPCTHITFGSFSFLRALRHSFSKIIYIEHSDAPRMPNKVIPGPWGFLNIAWHIERLRRKYRMRCAHHILTVSDETRRHVIESWFTDKRKVTCIPNSVKPVHTESNTDLRVKARKSLGLLPDTFVFGMVTRLSEEKGVDLALEAFHKLQQQSSAQRQHKLLIAGSGPEEETLKELAQKYGIEEQVMWLGFQEKLQEFYSAMDAIIFSSRQEGMPLALLEAMAAGVIPVAFKVGGISDVVSTQALGETVSAGNTTQLSEAMEKISNLSPAKRAQYQNTLKQHVEENFTPNSPFEKLLEATELNLDKTWRKRFLLSKLKDVLLSWLEFGKLWFVARSFPPRLTGRALKRLNELKPNPQTPTVCVLEESEGWGGAENHTFMLVKYLLSKNYKVEYLSGGMNLSVPPEGVTHIKAGVSVFHDKEKGTEEKWLEVFSKLQSRTLVFPTFDVAFGRSISFIKAARCSFEKIIFIEHTLPPTMPKMKRKQYLGGRIQGAGMWWHKEQLRRKLRMRSADKVIAVSDSVRQHFIEAWHCPEEKIVTIRNGIDCSHFKVNAELKEEMRKNHNLPQDAFVFGMMTRISPEKGVDLGLHAFAEFLKVNPQQKAYLVIAGDGPDREPLQTLGEKLGIADKILWLGYVREQKNIYALMDSIIATSRIEGLPLALLEGMACGAIPIAFRIGGMPEVICNDTLGWMIDPGDIRGFTEAMQRVSNLSPESAQKYRQTIRNYIVKNFNVEITNRRITEIIENG